MPDLSASLLQVLKAHHALWSGILQPEDVGTGGESFKDAAAVDTDTDGEDVELFKDAPLPTGGSSDEDDDAAMTADDDDGAAIIIGGGSGKQVVATGRLGTSAAAPPAGGSGRGGAASGPPSTSGRGPDSAQQKWPQEGYYDMQKR